MTEEFQAIFALIEKLEGLAEEHYYSYDIQRFFDRAKSALENALTLMREEADAQPQKRDRKS